MAGELTIFEPGVDTRDTQIAELKAEVRGLKADVARAQAEAHQARRESARALSALRQQLAPLYRALQMVFGELDAAGVEEPAAAPQGAAPASNARVAMVWEEWKKRLGEGPGKIITALLLHGEMNTPQLVVATGYHRKSIGNFISKLNTTGLINKNGGKFSLKQL